MGGNGLALGSMHGFSPSVAVDAGVDVMAASMLGGQCAARRNISRSVSVLDHDRFGSGCRDRAADAGSKWLHVTGK